MSNSPEGARMLAEIAQAEEELYSMAPPDPGHFRHSKGIWTVVVIAGVMIMLMVVGVIYALFEGGGFWNIALAGVFGYFVGGVGSLVVIRRQRRIMYDIYSQACKVVHYYKLLTERLDDPHEKGP